LPREEHAVTTLLVATNNPGKIREFRELLADLPVAITFPRECGLILEVAETGQTFEENARIKATAYWEATGFLTLADDSGLEVDALGGAPGVWSARYAGAHASDSDRVRKLLSALTDVPWGERTARFRCVVAISTPGGSILTAEGTCEGEIGLAPKGEHGFGYDPILVVRGQGGLTMAELAPGLKNLISHRARALMAAREILAQASSAQ
jgi:XTP/dITP diphosphohydrolase